MKSILTLSRSIIRDINLYLLTLIIIYIKLQKYNSKGYKFFFHNLKISEELVTLTNLYRFLRVGILRML